MDQATCDSIAAQLGLTPQRIHELRTLPFEKAVVQLDELKKEARGLYRKQVFKCHPDRNPNDDRAAERLRDLAEVLQKIEGLRLQKAAPPPVLMRIQYVYVNGAQPGPFVNTVPSYSTTASTTSTTYQAGRVVFVRPV
jgi:hypothetical protein